jgi:hypothetical protein
MSGMKIFSLGRYCKLCKNKVKSFLHVTDLIKTCFLSNNVVFSNVFFAARLFSKCPSNGMRNIRTCTSKAPGKKGDYIFVNDKDPSMEWSDITDRAAQSMFWTELFRGSAVTLAHM